MRENKRVRITMLTLHTRTRARMSIHLAATPGRAITNFLAHTSSLSRNFLAAALLTYGVLPTARAQTEGVDGNSLLDAQQRAAAAQPHKFVLSKSVLGGHFSMDENMHSIMDFVEDLFAVRIPKFVTFAVILIFAIILANIIPMIFDEIGRRFQAPRNYRAVVHYFVEISIIILGLWLALAAVGIDFLGIVLTFGVVTIAISAGVSIYVSNMFGGIQLQTEGRIQVGQIISVNGTRGMVLEMTLSCVAVRLMDDKGALTTTVGDIPNHYFPQYITMRENAVPADDANGRQPQINGLDALVVSKDKFN